MFVVDLVEDDLMPQGFDYLTFSRVMFGAEI